MCPSATARQRCCAKATAGPLEDDHCRRSGRAAFCKEEMPSIPDRLCQGKDKHFPTCLGLSKWPSESSLCSRGCDVCGGPSTTAEIIQKEESSVHTCECVLLIMCIVCGPYHLAKGLAPHVRHSCKTVCKLSWLRKKPHYGSLVCPTAKMPQQI